MKKSLITEIIPIVIDQKANMLSAGTAVPPIWNSLELQKTAPS